MAQIAHFLISLRSPLVVREPPALQDALRALAVEIVQLADRREVGDPHVEM